MKAVLVAAAIVAALVAIDRLALAAEERGWIYWRRKKASPGTRSAAMLEMQALLEPGKRHVIEAKAETREEDDSSGT